MMFHTVAFILGFLPVFLTGFFAVGRFWGGTWALCWLTVCSLFFYAWWNPDHVVLLVGSVMANYAIALKLRYTNKPRSWVTAGVGLNLALLGWFKYANFFLHTVAPTAPGLDITLPLAISFFTFQQIMFLVDTGRDTIRRQAEHDACRNQHPWGCPPGGTDIQDRPADPALGDDPAPLFGQAMEQWLSWQPVMTPPHDVASAPLALSAAGTAVSFVPANGLDVDELDRGEPVGPDNLLLPPPRHATAYADPEANVREILADGPADEHFPLLLPYATFVTFFAHLIAGPIVRPSEIIPQLTARGFGRLSMDDLAPGLLMFLLGLGKKLVLADMFGGFADTGFNAAAHGTSLTFFEAWYATLAYALQIYFDFSGYSDMAIGLARMLSIRFPLNFDSPYQASSIAAFWRRWHITLGGFLRDYVYIPLGGNRAGRLRQTGNLMVTMLLAGLWHGAAWNFVIWGGLHGLFLVVHAFYRRLFPPLPARFGQVLTLSAVILAWVPFRAASLSVTVTMLQGMAGLSGITLPQMIVSALPPLAAIADPVSVMRSLGDAHTLSFPEVTACLLLGWLIVLVLPNVQRMSDRARQWTLTSSFALSVQALFFAPHVAPFLYFQF